MILLRRQLALASLLLVASFSGSARAEPSPLPAVVLEERLDGTSAMLATAPSTGEQHMPGVRLEVPAAALTEPSPNGALVARLAAYAGAGIPVWLAVGIPDRLADVESWRAALREILRSRTRGVYVLQIAAGKADAALALYALRVAAIEARTLASSVPLLAIGGHFVASEQARARIRPQDVQPYADLLALDASADVAAATAWFRTAEPAAMVLVTHGAFTGGPDDAARQCVERLVWSIGTSVRARSVRGTPQALGACHAALSRALPLLSGDISDVDPATAALSIIEDGRDAQDRLPHRVLFDERTTSTLVILDMSAAAAPVEVSLRVAVEGQPVATDLQNGRRTPLTDVRRDPETAQVRVRLPPTEHLMLINFSEGASEVFTERTGITAAQQLTVEQIIARHQQRQNAEDQALENYIADVRMSQHFRPTMTDPGYDIVTENRYYVDESGVEWEELSFSVNGSRWGADRPPFPLLQPEKVLSLPLQLRFGDDYRYELKGTARTGGVDCYVVAFEPIRDDQALYRGTVWIDRRTFARVQVRTVQAGLSAPVVSNEETHRYQTLKADDRRDVSLLSSLSARQIVMIAGRNILLEKRVAFSGFRLNAPDFAEARGAARSSERIMYRDTDAGVRYFVKENGTRVVSTRQTLHAKALAMGTLLDPSYSFPLPIFGINYLDFEFGSPGTQFALLFGGVLAAGNIQRAKLGGTPLDGSLDFFGIAAPSTDRVFDAGGEREDERLLTWPLSAGGNIGWQYTPYQKATLQYQFRFDGFVRDRTTAESFRLPSSTTTHGLGGLWEFKRAGYSLQLNGTWFRRADWGAWGAEGATESSGTTYQKYTASVSRDFYVAPFQKVHLNAAYFGGRGLDRFSRYQFGLFDDTRIHGVPASGIRFDRLGMVRGSYSFNLLDQYRFDVFLDQGWGRDDERGIAWRPLTGTGIALNVRAPWSTILRADIGKSFLPSEYRGQGSLTAQIMVLKPLR